MNTMPCISEIVIAGMSPFTKRGMGLLLDWAAIDALHNSDELLCHAPRRQLWYTRIQAAVLEKLMKWVERGEARDHFMMWLFGPASAGKSVIAKRIAELAEDKGLLIATFFFSRTSSTRSIQDRIVPTLAFQMAALIPGTRIHLHDAIEEDPAIFRKSLQTQIDTLLMKPLQSASMQSTQVPFPKLIIIDGLDECRDSKAQVAILCAISRSITKHRLPIKCLAVSRPQVELVNSFKVEQSLRSIHSKLSLDDTYYSEDDLRLFLSDKFEQIRYTHPFRSTIPMPWPTEESLNTLVNKADGQFNYAATVVKFVEANHHRPAARLNIILGLSPLGTPNPFIELDALYKYILSSVVEIKPTMLVLTFYASSPKLADRLDYIFTPSHFLSLTEEETIELALMDLTPIVSFENCKTKISNASFLDFLGNKSRSDGYYMDMARARTYITCRTLQYVRGPDGIQAGDRLFFEAGIHADGLAMYTDQLRDTALRFDLDAFMTAAVKMPYAKVDPSLIMLFKIWKYRVIDSLAVAKGSEDAYEQLLYRYRDCFESRIQRYQSQWQLQLLLILASVLDASIPRDEEGMDGSCLDILLGMDDRHLHLVDRHALDLRHSDSDFPMFVRQSSGLSDIIPRYIDGDKYAYAALHCMRFLSNTPKYSLSRKNRRPEDAKNITHLQWMATCYMTLDILCTLLERANTSPELIQFMSDHDLDKKIQGHGFRILEIYRVDTAILAFLSRGGICVNWRIVSALQRARVTSGETDSSAGSDFEMDLSPHSSDTLSESDLMDTES